MRGICKKKSLVYVLFFVLKIMQVSKKLSKTFYILCWMNVSFYPEECIRNCWFKLTNGVDRGWSSVTLSSYVIDIPIGIRHHFLGNDNIGRVSPSFNSCIEMTYILHRCFNVWQKAVVCSAVKSGISRNIIISKCPSNFPAGLVDL